MDGHDLGPRWDRLLADLHLGPGPPDLPEAVLAAYADSRRRYHGLAHLASVLAALDDLWDRQGGTDPPPAARLAGWYHDVVYDPARADNEAASAARAQADLRRLGASGSLGDDVATLILATAGHTDPAALRPALALPGAAELLDADLAILAAPVEVYDTYARHVAQEYGHLSTAAFRRGRADVLRSLLDRPTLYLSRRGRERYEVRARANLARELATLAGR